MTKLYKVLRRDDDGKLVSPFRGYEYKPYKEYVCANFNPNPEEDCSCGYYATGIDGIIYSFRNLPGYEVWEVEVSGKRVEIDQFKRRYERIKLVRQVPLEEVRALAEAEEEKIGYKLAEALFPINPFKIKAGTVTDEETDLLKKWASITDSMMDDVENSVMDSVIDSVEDSVWDSILDSIWGGVWDSIKDSLGDNLNLPWDISKHSWGSIRDSIWDSIWAYISSLYPDIKIILKYYNHPEGENPFQPAIDLWHRGFVPSFDGKTWRLHAGENAEVVWEGEI